MTKKSFDTLHYIILFAIILLMVYLRLQSFGEPLERDLASYGYFSHQMLSGYELYTYLFDHHPPAIYWVYMAGELIWGYGASAVTNIGILFTLFSLLFLYLFLKKIASAWTALAGALFWALTSNSFLIQANQPNTELFMNTFMLAAMWSFLCALGGRQRYFVLTGILLAIASLFKTVALFPFLALSLYAVIYALRGERFEGRKRALRSVALIALPAFLIWFAVFIYFAVLGRFSDLWNAVFLFNLSYSESIFGNILEFTATLGLFSGPNFAELHAIGLLSILWLVLSPGSYGPLRRSFFIIVLIGIVIEVASPGKFYMHYYQLFLPILCILSPLALSALFNSLDKRYAKLSVIVPVAVFLIAITHIAYYQVKYLRVSPNELSIRKYGDPAPLQAESMGRYIGKSTGPCESVYEWGKDTGIYFYSQRRAAAGIIFLDMLFIGTSEQNKLSRKAVYDKVVSYPPAYIIYNTHTRWLDDDIFDRLLEEKYKFVGKKFMRYLLYENKFRGTDGRGDCADPVRANSLP